MIKKRQLNDKKVSNFESCIFVLYGNTTIMHFSHYETSYSRMREWHKGHKQKTNEGKVKQSKWGLSRRKISPGFHSYNVVVMFSIT